MRTQCNNLDAARPLIRCLLTPHRMIKGDRWFWSTTCVLIDPEDSPRIGWATTREEAQQQFAEAWRAWLARTELKEI
jgi:hypothetical protein